MLNFDDVLAHGPSNPSLVKDEEGDPDRPIFSLISGRYRHAKRFGGELVQHLFPPFLGPKYYRKRWGVCTAAIIVGCCSQRPRWHGRDV
jgi:hypothetical protein